MTAAVTSYDPAVKESDAEAAEGKRRLERLIFDRLTRLDDRGLPEPQLATSWSHDPDFKKWQFTLRPDVKWPDGSLLTVREAAEALAAANLDWRMTIAGDTLIIESNAPLPALPAELAIERNSIVRHREDGSAVGTGPFRVSEWQAGRRVVLSANDDSWGGRPYLDSIEIQMGRPLREQFIDLELGNADVIEIGLDQLRRARQENLRVALSSPDELMAILFAPGRPAPGDARLRQALALAIDRSTIHSILLQNQGEPAGGLLPEWLSGYAFLFTPAFDAARARELRAELSSPPAMTLGYDPSDAVARAVAERIALNARDAGLTLRVAAEGVQAAGASSTDARLVRIRLRSADVRAALAEMAAELGEPVAELRALAAAPGELYDIEKSLLADYQVIPLFYLPEFFAVNSRVENWKLSPLGDSNPQVVWLETEKP